MKTAYGVIWREHDVEQAGWLTIGAQALQFTPHGDGDAATHELSFDEIVAVELRLREREGETAPAAVVVTACDGRALEIASVVDKWITGELLTRMLVHGLRGGERRRQVLASVRLKPGCRTAAQELLQAGPPFDPAESALALHEAYVLDDEVLFLFETQGRHQLAQLADLDFWRAAVAWRELTTGEVRLVEPAYTWARPEYAAHPGLGF